MAMSARVDLLGGSLVEEVIASTWRFGLHIYSHIPLPNSRHKNASAFKYVEPGSTLHGGSKKC